MARNLNGGVDVLELIPAQAATSTVTGSGVDLLDYDGKLKIILMSSAESGDADETLNVKIQDSADNSSFADITGATFTEVVYNVDSTEGIGLEVTPQRRYIRAVGTLAGTTPVFSFGVVAVGAKKYQG